MGCGVSKRVPHSNSSTADSTARSKAGLLQAAKYKAHEHGVTACPVVTGMSKCPFGHGGQLVQEEHLGHSVLLSRCPLAHGSVGTGPFPGYVHGKNAEICAEGCRPDPSLGKHGRQGEMPQQTLIREALEFQDLYHKDKGNDAQTKATRTAQILNEIRLTGTYTHTFDELQHGARVAWRNAPKCSNRKFWEELKLLDARSASTPQQMYAACLEMLERATLSCVTTANIVVFRGQTPGKQDGPRVWNSQLIRFAGYKRPDGSIMGDPSEVDFTAMCIRDFGWQPPETVGSGMFDVLPLVLQSQPDQPPQMFSLPDQYVVRVPIRHPDNEAFSALGLQWYTVPAVSNMELSVGGIVYTAAPFNGWYADSEIVRNLTDAGRYNMCAKVAATMGLDTTDDASMWRDRTIVEVAVAVMHSFRQAGMSMVDHHTLMRNFFTWYNKERARRGYSPGNWKWIITPLAPTASRCYLELNKMTEYTLKPGYWAAPGWRQYRKALGSMPLPVSSGASRARTCSSAGVHAFDDLSRLPSYSYSSIMIAYATVTGNTQQYAEAVARALSARGSGLSVTLMSMEDFESDSWSDAISGACCLVVMSSTYGPGAPPSAANKFIAWLQSSNGEAQDVLAGKPICVLGFGSSCYPRFCAAADLFHSLLLSIGASALLPVGKADALAGEEQTVWSWVQELVQKLREMGYLDSSQAGGVVQQLPMSDLDKAPEFVQQYRLVQLHGEGLQAAPERGCHWATVLTAEELLGDTGYGASTKLLRLDISQVACGNYIAGDEVCIYGENDDKLVERFAGQLGISAERLDDMFLLQSIRDHQDEDMWSVAARGQLPLPNSYRTILRRHAGLNERVSFAGLAALASYAPHDVHLQQLASSYAEYSAWCTEVLPRWQDVFDLFPSLINRVPLATFFQVIPVIKPRYYSISSSSAATPTEVAITVGRLSYTLHTGEKRAGFCSSFLCQLQPGQRVRFRIASQPAFRLPLNLTAPVVMIASGTGLAPFRGFWHERMLRLQQDQQLGPAMLIYGCRSKDKDLLLHEEVQDMLHNGVIDNFILALSRDAGMPKTYVQDVIKQQAELLRTVLLHERCHVYVCGSSNMAQEVSAAVARVAGKQVLEAMVLGGRYHEDVFGINITDHKAARQKGEELQAIKMLAVQPLSHIQTQLNAGLDINAVDPAGSTLLHHACSANRADVVEVLLSRGASTNLVNYYGLTPAAEAAVARHEELTAMLRAHGCTNASSMHRNFYPLHAAVMERNTAALAEALDKGANPDQHDYQLVAPLHIAVVMGNTAMAETLLNHHANPNLSNRLGMTPLQIAIARDQQEMAAMLRSRNALIRAPRLTTALNPNADLWSADSQAGLQAINGMTAEDTARVRATWAFVSGEAFPDKTKAQMEEFGVRLFLALFDLYPNLIHLFPFKDKEGKPVLQELAIHGLKVVATLGEVLSMLQNLGALVRYLTDLIERHYKYGVELVHYDIVLSALAVSLDQLLGEEKLSAADKEAWKKVLDVVKLVAEDCYSKRPTGAADAASAGGAASVPGAAAEVLAAEAAAATRASEGGAPAKPASQRSSIDEPMRARLARRATGERRTTSDHVFTGGHTADALPAKRQQHS